MSYAKLIEILKQVETQVPSIERSIGLKQFFAQNTQNGHLTFNRNTTDLVASEIRDEYPDIGAKALVNLGGGGVLQPHNVATACIERVLQKVPAAQVASDLQDLITKSNGKFISVIAISGVSVLNDIKLQDNIFIMKPENLVASKEREILFNIDRWNDPIFDFTGMRNPWRTPQVALVIERPNQNLIGKVGVDPYQVEREKNFDIMLKAFAALTLSARCSPDFAFQYELSCHPAIPPGGLGGAGYGGDIYNKSYSRVEICPDACVAAWTSICAAPKAHWTPLQLSIARLGRSRSHTFPVDAAIDLGISLESCLVHNEKGHGAKGELRNKIGSRGAWLLGKDRIERLEISKTLKLAYDYRSAAVHSGQLNKINIEKFEQADTICSRILQKILEKGKFPDWERLVIGFDEEAWI